MFQIRLLLSDTLLQAETDQLGIWIQSVPQVAGLHRKVLHLSMRCLSMLAQRRWTKDRKQGTLLSSSELVYPLLFARGILLTLHHR